MAVGRTDLTENNGFIPEEKGSVAIQATVQNSAIEAFARRENMASRTKGVPRFVSTAPGVVAEGVDIPDSDTTLDEVVLTAKKYAQIFNISEEDLNDSLVDTLNTYKREWATQWARKYDNACLGVTVASDGTDTAPFTSLYKSVVDYNSASNRIQTAGALTFQDISDALGIAEDSRMFDAGNTVFMVHPKMLAHIRNMETTGGNLVLPDPLGARPGSLFGYPLVVSYGAATSSAASATPSGNPLLIVGNRNMLINGVRGGVESAISRDVDFRKDGVLLKTRVRRGFAVAEADAFAIVEKTAAA
jgi:HK97 family phage major capsid protein